jgi:light-regulated signal transduction histidine kinase (bacteriophytochrome)
MGEVDAFFAQLRHELRPALNAILGYSQLLLEEGEPTSLSDAHRADLARVAASGTQLLHAFNEILDPAGFTDGIEEYAYRLRYATRPPLTRIRSCVQTLLEALKTAPVGDDLRQIQAAASRVSRIIDNVEHTFRARVASAGDPAVAPVEIAGCDESTGDATGPGGSILVIDDEEVDCALLGRRLIR